MSWGEITGRCLRKQRYINADEAQRELDRWGVMGYSQASGKEVYPCRFCGGAHIGERRRRARAGKR